MLSNVNTHPHETLIMHYCEQCARSVEPVEPHRSSQICPRCGAALKLVELGEWTNIARLTNLAEAGFLTDELVSEGLQARVYAAESFSVLTDNWTQSYLIQVPTETAQEAAAVIRRRLAEDQFYEHDADLDHEGEDRPDPVHWRPVALVLVAGAMCFVLGQQFAQREGSLRPLRPDSLPATINAIGRPLFTEPLAGQPRYRLTYQWRQQAWELDADANGDGRFESHRQFHTAGGSW
jgi:endogenous inhibitor of DNA gyrase (YacG/DUF329 family)